MDLHANTSAQRAAPTSCACPLASKGWGPARQEVTWKGAGLGAHGRKGRLSGGIDSRTRFRAACVAPVRRAMMRAHPVDTPPTRQSDRSCHLPAARAPLPCRLGAARVLPGRRVSGAGRAQAPPGCHSGAARRSCSGAALLLLQRRLALGSGSPRLAVCRARACTGLCARSSR